MARALAIAATVLLLAACDGDDDSAGSAFSQEQLDAWANEVWDQVLPAISASADFCPEDPDETPSFSLREPEQPDIPEEAQPAVGAIVAEKIAAYCRSASRSDAASYPEDQIQRWAEQLIASGGATVSCPEGTGNGPVKQKPASAVVFDAGSDIPENARELVAQRVDEMLRDACDSTPR